MLEALKNPETLKGLAETESDIQQRIDKLVFLTLLFLKLEWSMLAFSVSLLPLSGSRALAAGSLWFVILTSMITLKKILTVVEAL